VNGRVSLVISTFPDAETAHRIATQLVTARLAACANVLPEVNSIYRWQGNVETASETLVLFKLASAGYDEFETKLKSLHPYDVPEIVAIEVTNGLPAYLQWAIENSS
jgi:periplasmic divalent cation tolerance protein